MSELTAIPADLTTEEVNAVAYRVGEWSERVAPSWSGIRRARNTEIGIISRLAERALLEDGYRSDTTYNNCLETLRQRSLKGKAAAVFYRYCRNKYTEETELSTSTTTEAS